MFCYSLNALKNASFTGVGRKNDAIKSIDTLLDSVGSYLSELAAETSDACLSHSDASSPRRWFNAKGISSTDEIDGLDVLKHLRSRYSNTSLFSMLDEMHDSPKDQASPTDCATTGSHSIIDNASTLHSRNITDYTVRTASTWENNECHPNVLRDTIEPLVLCDTTLVCEAPTHTECDDSSRVAMRLQESVLKHSPSILHNDLHETQESGSNQLNIDVSSSTLSKQSKSIGFDKRYSASHIPSASHRPRLSTEYLFLPSPLPNSATYATCAVDGTEESIPDPIPVINDFRDSRSMVDFNPSKASVKNRRPRSMSSDDVRKPDTLLSPERVDMHLHSAPLANIDQITPEYHLSLYIPPRKRIPPQIPLPPTPSIPVEPESAEIDEPPTIVLTESSTGTLDRSEDKSRLQLIGEEWVSYAQPQKLQLLRSSALSQEIKQSIHQELVVSNLLDESLSEESSVEVKESTMTETRSSIQQSESDKAGRTVSIYRYSKIDQHNMSLHSLLRRTQSIAYSRSSITMIEANTSLIDLAAPKPDPKPKKFRLKSFFKRLTHKKQSSADVSLPIMTDSSSMYQNHVQSEPNLVTASKRNSKHSLFKPTWVRKNKSNESVSIL